jgi:hypothetical protein
MSETINSNLQSALQPNATLQDKKEALTKNEQYEGEQSYEDKKEEIKKIKVEIAQDNPADYRNKFLNSLPSKITQYNLSQDELDVETKTEIKKLEHETDPNKLVEREVKIIQKIGQQGATKKITTFKKKINKVLDFNNKTKIDELKKQLIEFMKSNNIYYQAKKNEARELLRQLEISLTINNYDSSETLPFPIQIITGMGAILAVLFLTFLI